MVIQVNPKPSKLELYVEILRSLDALKASSIIDVQEKTNIAQVILSNAMSFLEKQDLIKRECRKNQEVYTVTPRGETVSKYFCKQPQKSANDEFSFVMPTDA